MISGTALNEGWSFLRSMVGISSSPVSEESESPPASLGGSSSGVVSAEQNEVTGQSCMKNTYGHNDRKGGQKLRGKLQMNYFLLLLK